MAQTLFQRLIRGPEVVEMNYYNPAKAKIGGIFVLDLPGHRDKLFVLREILDYKRTYKSGDLHFADYVLVATPADGDPVTLRARFMPRAEGPTTHGVLILSLYDEMKFNTDLDGVLRDTTGEFVVTEDATGMRENYFRPYGLTTPYVATVTSIKDANGDGRVRVGEVSSHPVEYWDFARTATDAAGQVFTQHLIVELDGPSKMQTLWRGEEVDASRVTVL